METIKWYNRQIYAKLEVGRRTQAVARARELGLMGPGQIPGSITALPMASATMDRAGQQSSLNGPVSLPPILTDIQNERRLRTRFVGRDLELARLQHFLGDALQGNGRPVFIDGSAGTGKTSLLAEFTRRALAADPNLLAARGACTALAGIGDPYLPFRELTTLLAGDVENQLDTGMIHSEQAHRLWLAMPQVISALIEKGPNLLDIFISGSSLLARAQLATATPEPWLSLLAEKVRAPRDRHLEQQDTFSQFSEFLQALARRHPLLLLLDDLHWADDASLALLFHLGRRLAGSRILIVGAYRPEALADAPERKHHTLREVVTELQRDYGQILIDIETKEQDEGRKFIDALLDNEPNQLNQAFREAFWQKTGGHPLFCVELLLELQNSSHLVQNQAGEWIAQDIVDWEAIPARVEAVIGQRLSHLDAVVRNVLQVASVEGEAFTAEVMAEVCRLDLRELVAIFGRELIRQQRLLIAQGIEQITPERQLTRYRFKHNLFQTYLYKELDEIERSYIHEAVGVALETLYGSYANEIAPQLAYHFQEANNLPQTVAYLHLASQQAARLFAYEEAIAGFQQALALVSGLLPSSETQQQAFNLHMDFGLAQQKAGLFEESLKSFQKAADLARKQHAAAALAQAALAYEEPRWRLNLPPALSEALLREALHGLDETETVLRARVWVNWVRTILPVSTLEQVERLIQQSLEMARQVNDPVVLFDALCLYVQGNRKPAFSSERMKVLAEMLHISESLGGYERVSNIYGFRLLEHLERGDIDAFFTDEKYFAQLSQKMHQPFYEYDAITHAVLTTMLAGQFEEAERLAEELLEKGRQMGVENYDGVYSMQMFTIRREQGRLRELAPLVQLVVRQNADASLWRPGLALLYTELDMRSEAQAEFEGLAENDFEPLPKDALWITCLVYLAEVCAYLGDAARAAILYRLLLPYNSRNIVVGYKALSLGAAARYLGLLAAITPDWTAAQCHFEDALAMNERMGARTWLAHTQYDYALQLLAHGQPTDYGRAKALLVESLATANAHGMQALARKIKSLNDNYLV